MSHASGHDGAVSWRRHALIFLVRWLGVPVVRLLEWCSLWPDLLGRRVRASMGNFGGYRPNRSDVVVCSWFKSGTNWMLQIALQIAYRGRAEFDNLHHLVPWPDAPGRLHGIVTPLEDAEAPGRSPTGLRIVKTHLDSSEVPYSPNAHYIAVIRDPKDVCVSGYHFLRAIAWGPLAPSVPRWVDYYLSDRFHVGSWARHAAGFWDWRERPNVAFLTFEQMKLDPKSSIAAVANVMGVTLGPDEFDAVVHRASFEYMKANGDSFDVDVPAPWASTGGYMIRSGQRGSARAFLSDEQRERIDRQFRAQLQALGSDLPYDDLFG